MLVTRRVLSLFLICPLNQKFGLYRTDLCLHRSDCTAERGWTRVPCMSILAPTGAFLVTSAQVFWAQLAEDEWVFLTYGRPCLQNETDVQGQQEIIRL